MGQATLSVTQMPSHRHNITWAQAMESSTALAGGANPKWRSDYCDDAGGSQSHTHDFIGSSGNSNNLPPYYVLAHIMRLA